MAEKLSFKSIGYSTINVSPFKSKYKKRLNGKTSWKRLNLEGIEERSSSQQLDGFSSDDFKALQYNFSILFYSCVEPWKEINFVSYYRLVVNFICVLFPIDWGAPLNASTEVC